MSRYEWRCPACGSNGVSQYHTWVLDFADRHRCAPAATELAPVLIAGNARRIRPSAIRLTRMRRRRPTPTNGAQP